MKSHATGLHVFFFCVITYNNTIVCIVTAMAEALQIYKQLLRGARRFKSYNYREYVKRRTIEEFKQHQHETRPDIIAQLLSKAKQQNEIVQRQSLINSLYTQTETVLEVMKRMKHV